MVNTEQTKPLLNSVWYDRLKFLAMIVLPAVGSLYFGLAQIWHLPKAEEVVGTVTVLDTFLGIILGISTNRYYNSDVRYDGVIQIEQVPGGPKKFSMELNSDPNDLENKEAVIFKVHPQ